MVGIRELPYYLRSYTYKHHKMSPDSLFAEMQHRLDCKDPFIAGKIGGFELWAMRVAEFGYSQEENDVYEKLCNNAGFFNETISNERSITDDLNRYCEQMKDVISNVDYLIRWQYPTEEYFVRKYCGKQLSDIDWLGVVYQGTPLGTILRGRKVLIISPFAELVEEQYARRSLIYSDDYLPEFELLTYKAVQTIAGNRDSRFSNWFEALDYMICDVIKMDFDIALIGCGAYSLPLCSAIKKSGRSAIHMGGDVQLLFGIIGKRWEEDSFVHSKRNKYWVYPPKNEVPRNADKVEDACYW